MAVRYKKQCFKCKKNYVLATGMNNYVICYDCQKEELNKPIKDPKMKKMFDIPEKFYKENSFLRSIKSNYLRYENLTEKQIAAFKKVVKDLKAK